jgi:hypothetical protein
MGKAAANIAAIVLTLNLFWSFMFSGAPVSLPPGYLFSAATPTPTQENTPQDAP